MGWNGKTDLVIETKRHPIFSILGCLCLCYVVGFVGDQGMNQGLGSWYLILDKPSWAAPVWLFAPIGAVTYGLEGMSLWVIHKSEDPRKGAVTVVFSLLLVLQAGWPWIFFACHFLFTATVWAFGEWVAFILAAGISWRCSKSASALLLPSILIATYISALAFSAWRLNPRGAGVVNLGATEISGNSKGDKFEIKGLSCIALECARNEWPYFATGASSYMSEASLLSP